MIYSIKEAAARTPMPGPHPKIIEKFSWSAY